MFRIDRWRFFFFFFDFSFVRCLLWWTNTATGSLTIKHHGRWYSSEIRPASRTWTRWLRWCVTTTTRTIHYPAASSAVLHIPPKTPFLLVTTWIQPMGRIRSPHSVTAHTVAPTAKSRPCPWWSHWISSQSVGPLSIRFHPSAGVSPIFMIALTSVSPMFGILNPSALNGFTKTKTFPFLLSTFSSQLFFFFLSFFLLWLFPNQYLIRTFGFVGHCFIIQIHLTYESFGENRFVHLFSSSNR